MKYFVSEAKFRVEVAKFMSAVKFWVGGGNILEIGLFNFNGGGGQVNNSGTLLGSKFRVQPIEILLRTIRTHHSRFQLVFASCPINHFFCIL